MDIKAIATAKTTEFNNPKSHIQNPKSEIPSIQLKDMGQRADKTDEARLEKACKDFEAIILNKMLSSMRKTVPEGGLFEKSYGEKIYQSMLDEELSKKIAHGKGMGLGQLLFQQLINK